MIYFWLFLELLFNDLLITDLLSVIAADPQTSRAQIRSHGSLVSPVTDGCVLIADTSHSHSYRTGTGGGGGDQGLQSPSVAILSSQSHSSLSLLSQAYVNWDTVDTSESLRHS